MLEGAAVYDLGVADRPAVSAFMAGVKRTARLKLGLPGLATTATRTGGRLVIQNDICTTDAHVIVVHVRDREVSVTYTDVHAERVAFFQAMLKPRGFTWEAGRTAVLAVGSPLYFVTGQVPGGGRPSMPGRPGVPRVTAVVPDRLEPRPQAVARLPTRGGPDGAAVLGRGNRDRALRLPRAGRRDAGEPRHRGDRRLGDAVR